MRSQQQHKAIMAKIRQQQTTINTANQELKRLATKAKKRGYTTPMMQYEAFRLGITKGAAKENIKFIKKNELKQVK